MLEAILFTDPTRGALPPHRYGFVTFESQETAENVRQQTSLSFLGKNMNVSEAYRKHKQQRQHNVPQAAIPPRGYVVYGMHE